MTTRICPSCLEVTLLRYEFENGIAAMTVCRWCVDQARGVEDEQMTAGDFAGVLSLQVILSGLAAWLGKVCAERIARREQANLSERLRRVEAALDAAAHVTKAQYEREFEIYRDLWDKMLMASRVVLSAPAIRDSAPPCQADHRRKQTEILRNAVGEFAAAVERNRPFYSEAVYRAIEPVYKSASEASVQYELDGPKGEYVEWARTIFQNLTEWRDHVMLAIRERMKQISTT